MVVEFDCDLPEDVVTRQIDKHIDLAIETCLKDSEVDPSSVNVSTGGETITIPTEEYRDLVKCSNYVYHWGNRVTTCKKCGNLNPGHCICASCGYDNSDDI